MRKVAKSLVLPLGLRSRTRPGDVVILLYHRIRKGPAEIDIEPAAFADQIARLAQSSDVLTLDQALSHTSRRGIVISFDDGYTDFYDRALPILVEHELPVVLYVPTGFIGRPHYLSWQALRDARSTGLVTIGSHTHNHASLAHADTGIIRDEMQSSKQLLEDQLGSSCDHFAFPWAVGSDASVSIARETFRSAARYAWRTNRAGRIDPHRLGRVPVLRSDGPLFFWPKARGALDAEGWIYRAVRRGPWREHLGT